MFATIAKANKESANQLTANSGRADQLDRWRGQRGSTMVMTAILMAGLVLAVGLCIDVARFYMVRTELQNAADAAALAGARELDSGTGGIADAVARANAIANNFGFNRAAVTISSVTFAVNLAGPYWPQGVNTDANAANIRFVRVTTTSAVTNLLFSARAFNSNTITQNRTATAGMSVGINNICDFFPIAVSLDPAVEPGDDPLTGYPAPNTVMTLNFTQGTGSSATLLNKDYIILEVPDINGNGAPETALLSAGLTNICASLNANINFHMTPSANMNNGPRQITDGVNTRFNVYAGGYGNGLQPSVFPPDSNVQEDIEFYQYENRTAVTAPNPNAPGQDQRRILISPIVWPGTYNPPTTQIKKWGAFFLKRRSVTSNPCNQSSTTCGDLVVEWIDERLVIGRGSYDPGLAPTSLTVPVLYPEL